MAYSRVTKIGDGTSTQFVVNFANGYIGKDQVTARVGSESDGLGAPVYRTITFLSPNLMQISGAPAGIGVKVLFERTVPKDTLLINYSNGDVLDEENLDTSQRQVLHAVQEVYDGRFTTLTQNLDMGTFKPVNVGDPTAPQDAATKKYVDARIVDLGPLAPDISAVATVVDEIQTIAPYVDDIQTVADTMPAVLVVAALADEINTIADEAQAAADSAAASLLEVEQQIENVKPRVYNFSGNGSSTTFQLPIMEEVDENFTAVYVNGVYRQKNTYTVSSTNLITFSSAPATGTNNIEVVVAGAVTLMTPGVIATQADAEAGVNNTRMMTSLRTAQAIKARTADGNYKAPGAGSVTTTVGAALARFVSLDDYLDADRIPGATDDTPALNRAIIAAGRCGVVWVKDCYWLKSQVPFHEMVTFMGNHRPRKSNGSTAEATAHYLTYKSQFRVTTGATGGPSGPDGGGAIVMGRGMSSCGITWIADGLVPLLPLEAYSSPGVLDVSGTTAKINSAKTVMQNAGTLFFMQYGANYIADNLILGFTKINDGCLYGQGVTKFEGNSADCWNGYKIWSSLDPCWLIDNDVGPVLTGTIPGYPMDATTVGAFNRGDYGYFILDRSDGTIGRGNFAYGYTKTLIAHNAPGLRWEVSWADYGAVVAENSSEAGIDIRGWCDNTMITLPSSVICKVAIHIDGTALSGSPYNPAFCNPQSVGMPVQVIGGAVTGVNACINLVAGELEVFGTMLQGVVGNCVGLIVGANVRRCKLHGATILNCTPPIVYASNAARLATTLIDCEFVGTSVSATNELNGSTSVRGEAPRVILEDTALTALGSGPGYSTKVRMDAGIQEGVLLRSEVVNRSVGSEEVRNRVYNNRFGSLQASWDLPTGAGHLSPVTDVAYDLGTSGNRVRAIYVSKIKGNIYVNAANDSAAASSGVAVGEQYRNGSVVQVRVS